MAYPTFHLADGKPLESLHILNNRKPEPYWWYMKDYKHFESPSVVIHNEGHRPPRNLTLEQMKVILTFLSRQFKKVNSQADEVLVTDTIKKVEERLASSRYLK